MIFFSSVFGNYMQDEAVVENNMQSEVTGKLKMHFNTAPNHNTTTAGVSVIMVSSLQHPQPNMSELRLVIFPLRSLQTYCSTQCRIFQLYWSFEMDLIRNDKVPEQDDGEGACLTQIHQTALVLIHTSSVGWPWLSFADRSSSKSRR